MAVKPNLATLGTLIEMTEHEQPSHEQTLGKRQLTRYLCDDAFSDCRITFDTTVVLAKTINFNRLGLGVFVTDFLPHGRYCQLSFRYESIRQLFSINELLSEVIYVYETGVGNQCGLKFLSGVNKSKPNQQLIEIEKILATSNNSDDRYGIYND